VQPLGWRAVEALQKLGAETADAVLSLRRQGGRAISFLPGDRPGIAERREMSADEGVQRLRAVASALVQAGAIDSGTADSVLAGLETALLARSRISPHWLWRRDMLARRSQQPAVVPAGLYRAVPVGVTIAAAPDSGLGDTSLLTLVIAPDLAGLTAAGRQAEPLEQVPRRDRWAALHGSRGSWPSATDDRGNSYQLDLGSWSSEDGGGWSGTLDISPVPAAGIRWLDLTVSPGLAPVRVDITGASRESNAAAGLPRPGARSTGCLKRPPSTCWSTRRDTMMAFVTTRASRESRTSQWRWRHAACCRRRARPSTGSPPGPAPRRRRPGRAERQRAAS